MTQKQFIEKSERFLERKHRQAPIEFYAIVDWLSVNVNLKSAECLFGTVSIKKGWFVELTTKNGLVRMHLCFAEKVAEAVLRICHDEKESVAECTILALDPRYGPYHPRCWTAWADIIERFNKEVAKANPYSPYPSRDAEYYDNATMKHYSDTKETK